MLYISMCNYVLLAVNHFFGFGLMNAEAMINRSLSWKTVPDQVVCRSSNITVNGRVFLTNGPRQANLVLIAYAISEGSGESARIRCSLIQAVSQEEPSDRKPDPWPPLNGWACAVKVCHDGMLEDTNSLDWAQITNCNKSNCIMTKPPFL